MGRTKGSKNKATLEKEKALNEQVNEQTNTEQINTTQDTIQESQIQEPQQPQEQPKELTLSEKLSILTPLDELLDFNGIEFTLKKYLPILEKQTLVQLVYDNLFSINKETKKEEFSHINRDVVFGYTVISFYTDLDFEDENLYDVYDLVKSSGLLDYVLGKIPATEIQFLEREITQAIKIKIPEYDNKKGFIEMIGEFLNRINDDVPNAINDLKAFNPEKLGNIMDILGKFDKFNNPSKYNDKVTPMNRQQRRASERKEDKLKN